MTLGNMRELSFPHARHFSEEPEPHSIDDVRDARIVVDRDIAYGHRGMPQTFAGDELTRLAGRAPILALHLK